MKASNRTLCTSPDGTKFWATPEQADAIARLVELNKGGIGTIHGYRPTTGYVVAPNVDINFISRFSTSKLYERRIEALSNVRFEDVAEFVANDPKLSKLEKREAIQIFEERKAKEIASLNKTLDGDRSDGHRQGHDRCYVQLGEGVKVNLVTEKGTDGLKHPVLDDGLPSVASIMIAHLELNRKVNVEGERKVVNSGEPVLMGNCINRVLNQRSVGLRYLSLKEDNFDSLRIQRQEFLPEDVADNQRIYDVLFG